MGWVMMVPLAVALLPLAAGELGGGGLSLLWPIPREVECEPGVRAVGETLAITTESRSPVALAAVRRYTPLLQQLGLPADAPPPSPHPPITAVNMLLRTESEQLDKHTDYSHTIRLAPSDDAVQIEATPFGAVYALETLSQLLAHQPGSIGCVALRIDDRPAFSWRGLLIDAGRRHYPVPLIEKLLDGMVMAKLNVLHLHLADYGNSEYEQFGAGGIRLESKRYPALTAGLQDRKGNRLYYNQTELASLIDYAHKRGVRVVPELEQPGHASFLWPLRGESAEGLEFCSANTEDKTGAQLLDDPKGNARKVLFGVLEEFAPLFPEATFHIGGDETQYIGGCTKENTIGLEKEVVGKVNKLKKQPMMWYAPGTTTKVATRNTIIQAWTDDYTAGAATADGWEAVESKGGNLYMDHPGPNVTGWADVSNYCTPPGS